MYATVADLRAEGVTVAQADDARLEALIDAATAEIDRVTGWFFEPRALTLTLDGRGAPTLELPAPPIRLDRVAIDSADISLSADELIDAVASSSPELISNVRIFDIYKGAGIEAGLKSVALGLILQETSRTLTDEDADQAMAAAIKELEDKFAAELRD